MSNKQMNPAVHLVARVGLLVMLGCIGVRPVTAQYMLNELFPEAFQSTHPEDYLMDPDFAAMELSDEQRLLGQEMYNRYSNKLETWTRLQEGTENLLDFKRNMLSEFRSILSPRQNELCDQLIVVEYFRDEAARQAFERKTSVRNDVEFLFLVPAVMKFLAIEDWQELEIRDAIESTHLSCQKSKEAEQQSVIGIFERWQRALAAELLDFQQRDFSNSTGVAFKFPSSIEQIRVRANINGPQFLQNHKFVSRFTMSPPDEIIMLLQTPFYLDAHMQPDGMFALLLSDELVKDLKCTPDQLERLKKLKEAWCQENPLPVELSVELKFGSNMSSKEQREESAAANKAFAAIENQVFEVLTATQRERLRQIWNQLVLSMGWSEVPLTFPDWRDYLELFNEQGQAFDRIHGEFRDEIEQLVEKRQADQQAAVQAYQKSVAETLNEEQKEKLQQVFGIQLEPRPIER